MDKFVKNKLLIDFNSATFKLRNSHNILPNSNFKIISFFVSLLSLILRGLDHSDPKLVHFTQIRKNNIQSITKIAALSNWQQ